MDKKLNILIPCAGNGSRFRDAGYMDIKPLIQVGSKKMIEVVIDSIGLDGQYIFIVRKQHDEDGKFSSFLRSIKPDCKIVYTDGLTQGAACSVLLAKDLINNDIPLIVANSDQYIEANLTDMLTDMEQFHFDGGILCFQNDSEKWSYAKLGPDGFVIEIAEKKVISKWATCGLYLWAHGKDMVKSTEQMIAKDIRTNGEIYLAPSFNEMILDGKRIVIYEADYMAGIGIPTDLDVFLKTGKAI